MVTVIKISYYKNYIVTEKMQYNVWLVIFQLSVYMMIMQNNPNLSLQLVK